jgi:hypothetical protein
MAKIDELLDGFNGGNREMYRKMLEDKDGLLACFCAYAEKVAKKKRCPAWAVISDITHHGSGVSAAIYELYRKHE